MRAMRSAKVLTLNFDQLRQLQAAMVVHSTDRIVELSTEGTAKKREFLGTVEKLDAFIAGASLHEPELEFYGDVEYFGPEDVGYAHVIAAMNAQHCAHVRAWAEENIPF